MPEEAHKNQTDTIIIHHLVKMYGEKVAVNDLSLQIPKGELFVLLGPNAAGKTTTLKVIAGLLRPTSGTVTINGYDVIDDDQKAKKELRFIPDFPFLYEKLTGVEFLEFIADVYGVERDAMTTRCRPLLEAFALWEERHNLIENYSHGMRQKLIITSAFLTRPNVMMIDEPMVGLDPASAKTFKNLLCDYARQGTTILLSTHTLSLAEDVAHRIGILHDGRLIACGTLQDLRKLSGGFQELEEVFLKLTREEDA